MLTDIKETFPFSLPQMAVVGNKHVTHLVCLNGKESCKRDRKRKVQTGVVLFALEVLKSVFVLMPSRPEFHSCGAMKKKSGMCLNTSWFCERT